MNTASHCVPSGMIRAEKGGESDRAGDQGSWGWRWPCEGSVQEASLGGPEQVAPQVWGGGSPWREMHLH